MHFVLIYQQKNVSSIGALTTTFYDKPQIMLKLAKIRILFLYSNQNYHFRNNYNLNEVQTEIFVECNIYIPLSELICFHKSMNKSFKLIIK